MDRFPTIHNNGTSHEELTQKWSAVYRAALTQRRVLVDAFPNARDYYPQDTPGAEPFLEASTQHHALIDSVDALIRRAEAVLRHLAKREAA